MTPALVRARFRRVFVAGVVSALALTACSGGGDDPVAAEKSVEATSTTDAPQPGEVEGSPEVVPFDEFDPADYEVGDVVPEVKIREPVEYPEMANNDEAGAEAAAQYMIDVLNYTYNTGDFTYLDAVAADDCSMCVDVKTHISDISGSGGRVVGPILIHNEIVFYGQMNDVWLVDLEITYLDAPIVNERGIYETNVPGQGKQQQQMALIGAQEGDWKLGILGEVAFK